MEKLQSVEVRWLKTCFFIYRRVGGRLKVTRSWVNTARTVTRRVAPCSLLRSVCVVCITCADCMCRLLSVSTRFVCYSGLQLTFFLTSRGCKWALLRYEWWRIFTSVVSDICRLPRYPYLQSSSIEIAIVLCHPVHARAVTLILRSISVTRR